MSTKKTTAKGSLFGYLGHFRQQKVLDEGHNNFLKSVAGLIGGPFGRAFPQFSASRGFKGDKKNPPLTKEQREDARNTRIKSRSAR